MKNKKCLTLADAKIIASGCESEALRQNWAVTIAIVDDGGHLLWLQRLDDAPLTSIQIASGKAHTSAMGRRASKVYEEVIAGGRNAFLSIPGALTMVEGGEAIIVEGETVGAVGISGVKSPEDAQVARAGINHFLASLNK
ncbi:MAG TPA: heme-binding protein [Gallionellaceae bacterium]|nr:heme-binding protein [Gallionellaceae bacterium]